MSVAAPTISREKRKDDDNTKKLTRVISTKLSIEDDNYLQQVTTVAYSQPNQSLYDSLLLFYCPV